MKSRALLSFVFVVLTSIASVANADGESDDKEIIALKKQKICNLSARATLDQIFWIKSNWFDPKSSYAIDANFKNLTKLHKTFFDLVNNFARFSEVQVNSIEDIRKARLELEIEYRKTHQKFAVIDDAEIGFEASAESLEAAIDSVELEVENLASDCDSFREVLKNSGKTFKEWHKLANTYRSFVVQAKQKRRALFDSIYQIADLALRNALYKFALEKTSDVSQALVTTLDADLWIYKVETWWTDVAIIKGIGRGLQTRYLQYEAPLAVIRADLGHLDLLEAEVAKYPDSPLKQKIPQKIKLYRDQLTAELTRIEKAGWKRQLDRQIELNNKRLATTNSLSCGKMVKQHLLQASTTKDLEAFRGTESLYAKSVDLCQNQSGAK